MLTIQGNDSHQRIRHRSVLLFGCVFPIKYVEFGVYGDPIMIWGIPSSIYLRGTSSLCAWNEKDARI